jgi:rhodanese-related sulfurtransferase
MPGKKITNINPDQLYKMIKNGSSLFLLDVRSPLELLFGKVKGVKNISLSKLPGKLNKLPGKSAPIVCICASGSRSRQAANFLAEQGYTNLYNLEGGTAAWMRSGNKL